MIYNLSMPLDQERFAARANAQLRKGCVVELTEKTLRTAKQNNYLHSILGVIAMEMGVTIKIAKEEYFKRLVNADLFVRKSTYRFIGERECIRSSAELTTEEMNMAIDRLRRWAAENGIYLPSPEDTARLRDIEIEMGRMRQYL